MNPLDVVNPAASNTEPSNTRRHVYFSEPKTRAWRSELSHTEFGFCVMVAMARNYGITKGTVMQWGNLKETLS